MNQIDDSESKFHEISDYLDDAEIAEDARFLLRLYREMVVEEAMVRRRAELLVSGIEKVQKQLTSTNRELVRKRKQVSKLVAQDKRLTKELRQKQLVVDSDNALTAIDASLREYTAQRDSVKFELVKLQNQKSLGLFTWNHVRTCAETAHQSLITNMQEAIRMAQENVGRKPRLVLVGPETFKSFTGKAWDSQIAHIGTAKLEASPAVIEGRAIIRFL